MVREKHVGVLTYKLLHNLSPEPTSTLPPCRNKFQREPLNLERTALPVPKLVLATTLATTLKLTTTKNHNQT